MGSVDARGMRESHFQCHKYSTMIVGLSSLPEGQALPPRLSPTVSNHFGAHAFMHSYIHICNNPLRPSVCADSCSSGILQTYSHAFMLTPGRAPFLCAGLSSRMLVCLFLACSCDYCCFQLSHYSRSDAAERRQFWPLPPHASRVRWFAQ